MTIDRVDGEHGAYSGEVETSDGWSMCSFELQEGELVTATIDGVQVMPCRLKSLLEDHQHSSRNIAPIDAQPEFRDEHDPQSWVSDDDGAAEAHPGGTAAIAEASVEPGCEYRHAVSGPVQRRDGFEFEDDQSPMFDHEDVHAARADGEMVANAMASMIDAYFDMVTEAAEAMNEAFAEAFNASLAEAAESIDDDAPDTYNDDPDETVEDLLAEPRKRTEPTDDEDRLTGDAWNDRDALPPKRVARHTSHPSEWPAVTGDMSVMLDDDTRDVDDLPGECESRTCTEPSTVAVRFISPKDLVAYCDDCAEDKIDDNEDKFDGGFRL